MRDEMEQYRRQETYRDLIDAELVPGETVIWQQAPEQGARVRGSVITRIFGLFWLAFSLVWDAFALTAASAGGPALTMIFPIFGLPFVAIGVWLVFLMPGRQNRQLNSTLYAATDRRLLILTAYPQRTVRAMPLEAIRSMTKRVNRNGSGDLYFGLDMAYVSYGGYAGRGRMPAVPFAFYGIDADEAQRAIQLQLDSRKEG